MGIGIIGFKELHVFVVVKNGAAKCDARIPCFITRPKKCAFSSYIPTTYKLKLMGCKTTSESSTNYKSLSRRKPMNVHLYEGCQWLKLLDTYRVHCTVKKRTIIRIFPDNIVCRTMPKRECKR